MGKLNLKHYLSIIKTAYNMKRFILTLFTFALFQCLFAQHQISIAHKFGVATTPTTVYLTPSYADLYKKFAAVGVLGDFSIKYSNPILLKNHVFSVGYSRSKVRAMFKPKYREPDYQYDMYMFYQHLFSVYNAVWTGYEYEAKIGQKGFSFVPSLKVGAIIPSYYGYFEAGSEIVVPTKDGEKTIPYYGRNVMIHPLDLYLNVGANFKYEFKFGLGLSLGLGYYTGTKKAAYLSFNYIDQDGVAREQRVNSRSNAFWVNFEYSYRFDFERLKKRK